NYHFYPMTGAKKIQKTKQRTALAILLLLLVTAILAAFVVPARLKNYLSDFTDKKSEGVYTLSIGKLKFRPYPFSVKIQDISLSPDKEMAIKYENSQEKTFYSFAASDIEIEEIQLFSLIRNRKFFCRKVRIVNPAIKLE